ncbi:serpin I2-like [Physella acuta]|uniref:serpin I2-like n=1 Tax=Physella acuta TaxID=109671 RepID=UPI0027DCC851|nr:serpin I2-like [Physella acuta]
MISGNMFINYKKDEPNQFEVGEIPYAGGRFSMYIALPLTDDGIASLEKYLSDPHNVNCLFMDLKIYYAEVKIPKFTTETTLDLMKPLKELGIAKAFGPGAEFPRITSGTTHISQVIHKVRFDVTQTGTTAAAETTEETNKGPALTTTEADIQFVADHPFLYFLRDRETGLILFQGKFSG